MVFRIFICLIISLSVQNSHAQKEMNNWFWGHRGKGMTFNTQPPSAITSPSPLKFVNSNICVSDTNGNFLFASNSYSYYNQYTNITDQFGVNERQLLFLPISNQQKQFYVFSSMPSFADDFSSVLYCRTYDTRVRNGLGGIVSSAIILNKADFVFAATPHINNEDYWLTILQLSTKKIFSFLITDKGASMQVVTSYIYTTGEDLYISNKMRFNHNGTKLYRSNSSDIELFDFDKTSALLSKPILIHLKDSRTAEFSPDDSKLYVSTLKNGVFQVDLSSEDSTLINQSIKNIYNKPVSQDIQIGPDKKIYFLRIEVEPYPGNPQGTYYPLYCINSPNSLGRYCRPDSVNVFCDDDTPHYSLPYYVTPFLYEPYRLDFPDEVCPNEAIFFRLKGEQNIRSQSWSFGDGESNTGETPRHTYLKDGIYEVVATITDYSNKTYRCRKEITVKTKIKNIGRIQHD